MLVLVREKDVEQIAVELADDPRVLMIALHVPKKKRLRLRR